MSSLGDSSQKASIAEARLGAMVFCRSIACLLGYPVRYDPSFTNRHLLDLFLQVIVTCAESGALWDFNMHDLSTVLAPLLDYAEVATGAQDGRASVDSHPLAHLDMRAIEWMQDKFTFGNASNLTEELDTLTRLYSEETAWVKWFEFVRYTESIQDHGYGAHLKELAWHPWVRTYKVATLNMFPMESSLAKQQFFATCCNLHGHLPANEAFKNCTAKFFQQRSSENKRAVQRPIDLSNMAKMQYKTTEELTDDSEVESKAAMRTRTWSDSTYSSHSSSPQKLSQNKPWGMPVEFTAAMSTPCPISARMAELLEGSIPEPRDTNWHNNGSY